MNRLLSAQFDTQSGAVEMALKEEVLRRRPMGHRAKNTTRDTSGDTYSVCRVIYGQPVIN